MMSLETASIADHRVVRPAGKTTEGIKGNGLLGPRGRRQTVTGSPPPTPGCHILGSHTF